MKKKELFTGIHIHVCLFVYLFFLYKEGILILKTIIITFIILLCIENRDIKPENLLFEPIPFMERVSPLPPQQPEENDEPKEDEGEFVNGLGGGGIGQVKIADFGLSKVVWDQVNWKRCIMHTHICI